MKSQLYCAIKKDIKEYLRSKKNLLFALTLFLLCAMVFFSTKFLPTLIISLTEKTSNLITNADILKNTLLSFFPSELKANMGVLASDIAIFYGIVVILTTYNLIIREIKNNKWIFPIGVGYKPFALILSKGVIYGIGSAVPAAVLYILYYFIGSIYLVSDYPISVAISNAIVLGVAMASITYITIVLTTLLRHPIMSATTMIGFIAIAPDIFALFTFGKYLPTHLLTYIYNSSNNLVEVVIPIIELLFIMTVISCLASKKSRTIDITR